MMEAERMDTLLTTVVGGVIVATVGAVHAFYFGGVRERQRRLREEQEVSSERRTQAIIEIIARAQKVVTGVQALGTNAAGLPGHEHELDKWGGRITIFTTTPTIERLRQEWQQVLQQRDSISHEMESLRNYYLAQELHLLPATRNLFESLEKDFNERYTPLSAHLEHRQSLMVKSWAVGALSLPFTKLTLPFTETDKARIDFYREFSNVLRKEPEMMKAAKYAQEWNFDKYRAAFSSGYSG
jgi:hypothetical protein